MTPIDAKAPIALAVDGEETVRRFKAGASSVMTRVTFQPGTGNRARTPRRTFHRCRAAVVPRFTG